MSKKVWHNFLPYEKKITTFFPSKSVGLKVWNKEGEGHLLEKPASTRDADPGRRKWQKFQEKTTTQQPFTYKDILWRFTSQTSSLQTSVTILPSSECWNGSFMEHAQTGWRSTKYAPVETSIRNSSRFLCNIGAPNPNTTWLISSRVEGKTQLPWI